MPGGGGTTNTVSTQKLAPEQRALLKSVIPVAKEHAETPVELFPESTIADFNPLQQAARQDIAETAVGPVDQLSNQSIDTVRQLSGGSTPGQFGAMELLQAGRQAGPALGELLGDFQSGQAGREFIQSGALLDPATNPVLGAQTSAAIDPIAQELTQRILPGIRSNFVGNNMFGSSRQGIAEGQAIDSFVREAGDIATGLQANNFNQGLEAMTQMLSGGRDAAVSATGQALGAGEAGTQAFLDTALQSLALSPSLAQLAFLPGMTLEGLGESQRSMDQARLSEEAERFTTEQMLPFLQAQDVAQLAFGLGGGSAVTSANQNAAFDPVGTLLGGLALTTGIPGLGIPSILGSIF